MAYDSIEAEQCGGGEVEAGIFFALQKKIEGWAWGGRGEGRRGRLNTKRLRTERRRQRRELKIDKIEREIPITKQLETEWRRIYRDEEVNKLREMTKDGAEGMEEKVL